MTLMIIMGRIPKVMAMDDYQLPMLMVIIKGSPKIVMLTKTLLQKLVYARE